MNEADKLVLEQLLKYCQAIEQRIADYDINESKFIENSALFDMLLMPVFQIGEIAGALSAEYIKSHRDIPWSAIRGFRNIIAHDYGVVAPLWAWNTIQCDIPALQTFLTNELSQPDN